MYYKYEIEKEQVSYDNGQTWTDTYATRVSSYSVGAYETLSECEGSIPPPPTPTGDTSQYLTFDIVSGGTIVWKARTGNNAKTISYSMDNGITWTQITSSTAGASFNVSAGDKVLFKGNNTRYGDVNGYDYGSAFSGGTAYYNVYNNIMSLINADNFENLRVLTDNHTFHGLFYASNVINASGLILPATTLVNACYWGMFRYCTSLTTAPALPATTMTEGCYASMFYGCTSLTTAPSILPATTLANDCYGSMFFECHSLTTAPVLPATTLTNDCYDSMFGRCYNLTSAPTLPATALAYDCYASMFFECTSLTSAPALPATTLAENCYRFMFASCSGLTSAPALPATTLTERCYMAMFQDCASLTAAPALPATTLAENCYGGMFAGCTSLTTAPELPATTLVTYCYANMFEGCTSLTSAPELPATTLANFCYQGMFAGCTILSYIKCLATDISAPYCTSSWLVNVSSTGTFIKASSMNDWSTGASAIPTGWTVQNA